jgi:hypothetical protein
MTQEQKRIKLAKADGEDNDSIKRGLIPDYFNDLNAVHKLFECIPQNLKPKYFTILCSQVSSLITLNGYYEATEATAEQRCEAIGKTLNLW